MTLHPLTILATCRWIRKSIWHRAAKSTRRGSASIIPWLHPLQAAKPFTYIAGGSVNIQNESYYGQGVISAAGSIIDVSGGYGISRTGVVTGGNAGALSIQGSGIVLDGQLKGYSIQGNNGGSITLTAQGITVAPSAPSNQNPDNALVLGQNQLDDTGFTQINLQSVNDTVVEAGVNLSPSSRKTLYPHSRRPQQKDQPYQRCTIPDRQIILFRRCRNSFDDPRKRYTAVHGPDLRSKR